MKAVEEILLPITVSLFDTSGNHGNTNILKIWSAFEFRRLLSFQFYPFHLILFGTIFQT